MQRSKSAASNDASIDFGHRKRTLVQITPKQPKKNQLNIVFSWFSSFYPQLSDTETDGIVLIFLDGEWSVVFRMVGFYNKVKQKHSLHLWCGECFLCVVN